MVLSYCFAEKNERTNNSFVVVSVHGEREEENERVEFDSGGDSSARGAGLAIDGKDCLPVWEYEWAKGHCNRPRNDWYANPDHAARWVVS